MVSDPPDTKQFIQYFLQAFKCKGLKHVVFNREARLVGTVSFCNPSLKKIAELE